MSRLSTKLLSSFGLLAATASMGCNHTVAAVDCSLPFSGVDKYRISFLSGVGGSTDGQMAIPYFNYNNDAEIGDYLSAFVRIWDGKTWSTQPLTTASTLGWFPSFARNGGRWYGVTTLQSGTTQGHFKAVFFQQRADGTFSAPEIVHHLKDDESVPQGGFAIGSDGRMAIVSTADTNTDKDMIFSENLGSGFVSNIIQMGGVNVAGYPVFTTYDKDLNPVLVYTPGLGSVDQPVDLHIVRRRAPTAGSAPVWDDHVLKADGSRFPPFSFSAVVNTNNVLITSYASFPTGSGSNTASWIGQTYDLANDVPGSIAGISNFGADAMVNVWDTNTQTVLSADGVSATIASWWHGTYKLFTSSYDAKDGFKQGTAFHPELTFPWSVGVVPKSCTGGVGIMTQLLSNQAPVNYDQESIELFEGP